MDGMLIALGLAKLLFGLLVGVVGIGLAARMATRFAGFESLDEALRSGNVAVGIVEGGAILATALLVQHAVAATFGALDLLRYASPGVGGIAWIGLYALVHVGAALGLSAILLILGMRAFVRLAPEVDEIAEIRGGNIASAIVLSAFLVGLALIAQQGLETVLEGVLPIPALGRDGVVAPS